MNQEPYSYSRCDTHFQVRCFCACCCSGLHIEPRESQPIASARPWVLLSWNLSSPYPSGNSYAPALEGTRQDESSRLLTKRPSSGPPFAVWIAKNQHPVFVDAVRRPPRPDPMLGRGKQFVQPEIADQQYDQKWNRNQERVQVGMNCRVVHDSLRYAPACIKARRKRPRPWPESSSWKRTPKQLKVIS